MGRYEIHESLEVRAPIALVFDQLTDHVDLLQGLFSALLRAQSGPRRVGSGTCSA